MRALRLFMIVTVVVSIQSHAQDISKLKVSDWLCCDLHTALSGISKKHKVKFDYDIEEFRKVDFNEHHINKPLELILQQICEENKLKYYISASDTVIHFVDRRFVPEEKILKTIDLKTNKEPKYEGEAVRFNFSISGKVVDDESIESLPFVTIMVKGSNIGTTSNLDGLFTLLHVPSDTVTLVFYYLGYQRREYFLTPNADINNLLVDMKAESIDIHEVVISSERTDILQANGSQTSMIKMSPLKLTALPNLGEKDILRSFQLMPGISAANENSSGLYVRGGTPDQVLVQYDGFTVYNVEHLFGFFSAFNSNAIKDVQLYKGGFDAKYGGRLSSVVYITGKEGNQREFNGGIDLSMLSANAYLEFPVADKVSVIMAGRRSWKSPLYNKIFEQFTEENESPFARPGGSDNQRGGPAGFGGGSTQQKTKSYFYDLNTKVTYRPTKSDIISFSLYNGRDNLDNSIEPQVGGSFGGRSFNLDMETIDLTKWGNTGSSIKWAHKPSEKFYLNSLFCFSNYYSMRERSTSGFFNRGEDESTSIARGVNEDNNLYDFSAKTDIEYQLSNSHRIEVGVQAIHNKIDYQYLQNDTISVVSRDLSGETYSAYVQDKVYMFNKKITFTPGLRYNFYTITQKSYFEPRLNMQYQVNDHFKLKGAFGNYYQFAKRVIREDIREGSRDFWVLSDDDRLPVSSSLQYIAGFALENYTWLFDVEGFYKSLKNVTEYSLRIEPEFGPGGSDRQSLSYNENFFTGTGLSRGIDFLFQKKVGDVTGWTSYTIQQVTNHIDEFGDYDYYASQDVTHEFKQVVTCNLRRWDIGANWIFATGRPYTSPEGGYNLTLLDGSSADFINVSVKNGNRLPSYHRLDLSLNYKFSLGEGSPATLGFSVFNVYNRANVWYMEYEVIDNEVIELPVYYLGITPNISFTLKFK